MTGTEIEQFLGASRNLADRRGLPTSRPRINQSWNPREVHTVKLGTMLGQVAIMPQQADHVSLAGYGDDKQMISRLHIKVRGGVLRIEGKLPFKPGRSGGPYNMSGGGGVIITGGSVHIGNGAVITGGSVHIGGRSSFSTSGRDGQRMLIVNGREVDLSRHIQLVLSVPVGTNVRVGDMVGAVGIGPNLGGVLRLKTHFDTHIFAHDVTKLSGEVSGQGHTEVRLVQDSADIYASGQGNIVLGSVNGKFNASASGRGNINASRVSGDVDANVSGMGSIVANGRTYSPRW